MKKLLPVIYLATTLFSSNVFADGCTNPQTNYDQTYCTAKLFLASDNELNTTYNQLKNILPAATKHQLIEAQRSWIQFRDNACSSKGTIDVGCNYQVNKDRLTYLQDRLRECQTGHCQAKLIADQNFKSPTQ